ncbi:hypothetical protein B1R32_10880 [Abditibacterium utsteinense]|uniref:DUF6843 domain-containing protein n=1 Tax=Abditibacterium utsteinense TaxID=1960156 RepID=A0A2S8SST6_9BACT|nr:hypothetical protein [Abditibacterium utsteinense]PQV63873.1 hypothetical protein B1R32_10880 [Abditibacterium utsteinense]
MNTLPKSVHDQNPPLGRKVLSGIAVLLVSLFPLWLLLMSGFIVFVPPVTFLAWLIQQAKRRTLKSQWKLSLALFVGSLALSGLVGRLLIGHAERPQVYLLQQGYVGWFRVRWNIPRATPLSLEEGHYLLPIPANGLLNTSTVMEEGWMSNTFYYVDKAGRRIELPMQDLDVRGPMVWAISGSSQELIFFVGTREQFDHAGPDKNGSKPRGSS